MPLPVRAVLAAVLIAAGVSARPPRGAATGGGPESRGGDGLCRTRAGARAAFHDGVGQSWATRAGDEMLRAGGSAVDAAIAAQLVLNLVEPQSSGIGGGAFLVLYSAGQKRVLTYDARETAPVAARQDRFLDADGKPLPFAQSVNNGMAVATPGLLRGLELAHKEHGKLPWADLFAPAIRRAGLSGIASLARAAGRQQGAAEAAGRRGLFLRARRPALAGGACAEESRVRPNAARDRGARRRRLLPWRDRARYRRGRARSRQARRSESGRPGGLSGQASRAGLRRVPGLRAVRHGAAQRSAGGVADAGRAGAVPMSRYAPNSAQAVHYFAEAGRLAFADRVSTWRIPTS